MQIVANFKMNLKLADYKQLLKLLKKEKEDTNLVLCPPFVYLPYFSKLNYYNLGAQDVSENKCGNSTGQVSAEMLKEFSVSYCIVGHSERRKFETNKQIAAKVMQCVQNGITPILCVGEKHKNSKDEDIIEDLLTAFKQIKSTEKVIVAYEPVWAVGSGEVPTNEYINKKVELIKNTLKSLKLKCPILYGGSVDENNISTLKNCKVDGFLIGGLSLKFEKLLGLRRLL